MPSSVNSMKNTSPRDGLCIFIGYHFIGSDPKAACSHRPFVTWPRPFIGGTGVCLLFRSVCSVNEIVSLLLWNNRRAADVDRCDTFQDVAIFLGLKFNYHKTNLFEWIGDHSIAFERIYNFSFGSLTIGGSVWPQMDENVREWTPSCVNTLRAICARTPHRIKLDPKDFW